MAKLMCAVGLCGDVTRLSAVRLAEVVCGGFAEVAFLRASVAPA